MQKNGLYWDATALMSLYYEIIRYYECLENKNACEGQIGGNQIPEIYIKESKRLLPNNSYIGFSITQGCASLSRTHSLTHS